jgi:cysteine-rich repeat protein
MPTRGSTSTSTPTPTPTLAATGEDDGVCEADDRCPGGDDRLDDDEDGTPDACDLCAGDDSLDADADGVPDDCDVCADGDDRIDSDEDEVPDDCDACHGHDDAEDVDEDGVPDGCDVCASGDDSADADEDGTPDACDCDDTLTCAEGEVCLQDGGDPLCVCAPLRYGAACDGVCACENGGLCEDGRGGDGSCECPVGFGGPRCADAVSPCDGVSCENDGECVELGGGAFECVCPTGFVGPLCETDIDDCAAVTCQNGGTCVDDVAGFTCECDDAHTGTFCERERACAANPCLNGGVCREEGSGFACTCPRGYIGATCATATCAEVADGFCCNPGDDTRSLISDGNPCTADSCDAETGVVSHEPLTGTSCADGDSCNGAEVCQAGTCSPGTPTPIDDDNACTIDACDPGTGLATHTPTHDGTQCCDPADGSLTAIDDGVACTDDLCDPATGAVTHDTPVGCGDGRLDLACGEACDDGNRESGDGCSARCERESCGDGVVARRLYEVCDDGPLNSDTIADRCRTSCLPPRCGDGVVDRGEECDDGDVVNLEARPDGCRSSCYLHFCGDGVLDTGEECDDGNDEWDDGCSPTCALERCGDGVVQPSAGEECDDGGFEAGDGCGPGCLLEYCGDRIQQPGEACDQGPNGGLTCRPDCTPRTCGATEVCDLVDNDCDGLRDEGCANRVVMVQLLDSVGGGSAPYVLPTTCESAFDCSDENVRTTDACVAGRCEWTYEPCDGQDFDACLDGRYLGQDELCTNTGPLLLWDFEDDGAPQVLDLSGTGNTGVPANAMRAPGRFGDALDTRGGGETSVHRRVVLPSTNFTIGAWIATTSADGGVLSVLAGDEPIGGAATRGDRALDLVSGVPGFSLDHVADFDDLGATDVADGEWHHLALTCEKDVACIVPGFCYSLNSKANGSTCVYDNECQSTHCGDVSLLCSECEEDTHCGSQQACVAGVCVGTCGNGTCELGFGETCANCSDCGCGSLQSCVAGVCVGSCGNGTCELGFGETCANCSDCGCGSLQSCVAGACVGSCGNGTCELGFGETCANCSDCACGSGNVCSGGICVAGCTGDEQCPFGQYCNLGFGNCSGPNPGTCTVRKPAGAACCRTGECWITGSGQPSPCVFSSFWGYDVCQ